MEAYLGVDVGTGSVRCAAFDREGNMLGQPATREIKLNSPCDNYYQQSSTDIWHAVSKVITEVIQQGGINVLGIGFDATCSLVNIDQEGNGISIDPTDPSSEWDVILWMDHRSQIETDLLNSKPCKAHSYVGRKFSPEMELPKLMWIKRHMPDRWNRIAHSFDLVDFLTYKCTGNTARSVCTLVCKWGWIPSDNGGGDWEEDIIELTGLTELRNITTGEVMFPGSSIGSGLTEQAARKLGLRPGTPVGAGLIDAHAGALGILQTTTAEASPGQNRMAIIAGTSCCHMFLLDKERLVPGVWGPYRHALLPHRFLLEGGQTTAGATLDWLQRFTGKTFTELETSVGDIAALDEKNDLTVVTDFHGNRSPLADPSIKGSISGLTIATDPADVFVAIMQGLAMGTRHITERIQHECNLTIGELVLTGGLAKSKLFQKINANVNQVIKIE